jgi:hypothetical protein
MGEVYFGLLNFDALVWQDRVWWSVLWLYGMPGKGGRQANTKK